MAYGQTSLLRSIQESAADPGTPVTALLRRCLILASRLKDEPLIEWVNRELNGYPMGAELPPYRTGYRGRLVGYLMNPAVRRSGADLPESAIPEEFRGFLDIDFRQPVAELESLVSVGEPLQVPLPPELTAMIDRNITSFRVVEAHVAISRDHIVGLLDIIRSRSLSFALAIEQLDPEAGEADPRAAAPIPAAQVQHVFHNTIYGNANLAQSSQVAAQTMTIGVRPGDIASLIEALTAVGVTAGEIGELREILDRETAVDGPETRSWMERIIGRVTRSTGTVAAGVVAQVIGNAITAYWAAATPG
ncbi:MAG: hypothetical protein KF809_14840 [Chloroflexi bacterium]|nr:hypothetical protein [Chloroflexota bacterium]